MNHAAAGCSKSTPPTAADFDETGGRFFFGINALYARKLAFKCTLTASRFEII